MIGIVLVTHGSLGDSFRTAVEHIVGNQEQFEVVAIGPNDDMDQKRDEIIAQVKQVDIGKGAIVVTDMFGGTPSNLALSVLDIGNVEVLAGMNLPMLIKLAKVRQDFDINQALEVAQDAGKKYINVASQVLAKP